MLRQLHRKGLLSGVPKLPAKQSAVNAYKAFQAQAQGDLNLMNKVMQYKAKSSYVSAVNAAYFESQKSRQKVLNVMGKHSAAEHMSLQEATRRCIHRLADKGIPAFVDKSGREWSPEAYVMMDMRSTLANTARAAQNMRCDEYGIKLIGVSSHMGARPKCAPYQGKIYSRDGSGGVTTDGQGNKIYFTPLSETSYGEPDGLFGINCGHVQYPFVPGCSFQQYFPYPEEENAERYRQLQQQRYLERQIRASKRECMMLDETGDEEGGSKASARLKNKQRQYEDYCDKAGLKVYNDRTQVLGFDRSVSSKAAWENRKAQGSAPVPPTNGGKGKLYRDEGLTSGGGSDIVNNAKAIDMLNDKLLPNNSLITAQQIIDELGTTKIGQRTLRDIKSLPERIKLTYERRSDNVRGIQEGNSITIYLSNCKNVKWAARSIIHEITHYKYGIGQSQWAECVCISQELKHARNRDILTIDELRTIIKAVKEAYPEYNWRKGGIINGRRKPR